MKPIPRQSAARVARQAAAPVSGHEAATSGEEFNEALAQWFEETLLANYEAYGKRSTELDSKVKIYFAECARSHHYPCEEGLLERVQRLGEELLDENCADPLVVYYCGNVLHRLERPAEARPLLEESVTLLEDSDYPRRYAFYAARRLEWAAAEAPDPSSRRFVGGARKKMQYLGQAAGDPHFADGNQRFYLMDVLQVWDDPCANPPHADVLIEELDATADLDPWIEHVVKGLYHVGLAWEARGGGRASTVTAEGWKVFGEELETAETHLVAAHELHPEFPEAATAMIPVGMAGASELSPKEWFDRAVAAQFDYRPAYTKLIWALRPRWGGSHRAMYDFGLECLNTGRFDTDVPRYFLKVVWDIGSEMDDWRTVYRRPDTYRHMKVFFNGMLSEPSREAEWDYFRSVYGIFAWAGEEYEDARKRFDELGDKVDPTAFKEGSLDVDALIADVYFRTGPLEEEYLAAEALFEKNQPIEAIPVYEALSEKSTDNPHVRALLEKRMAALRMQKRFLDGQWIDILPDETFHGWEEKGGEWSFDADGSLKGTGRKTDDQLMLVGEFDVPDNYEIRGKVTASSFVGVVLGYTGSGSPKYVLFHLDSAREKVSLAKEYATSPIDRSKEIPETNRFHLQVWESEVTVYVNDEPVFVAEDVSELGSPRDGRIGIGALAYRAQGYSIQYHALEIRRLKEKPEKPEE